jgi:hypothetical protein
MTSSDSQEGAGLRAEASPERQAISPEPLTVEIVPDERMQEQIGRLTRAGDEAQTLRLEVEGVTSDWNPEVGIRVFLNLPQADASTPTDDPHYVTTFAFFEHKGAEHGVDAENGNHGQHGGHGHDEHGSQTFYANLTPTIQDLYAAGLYQVGEPLLTTLVTVPIAEDRRANEEMVQRAIPFTGVAVSFQE